MICPSCGKEIGNSPHCIYCGAHLPQKDTRFDTTVISSDSDLRNRLAQQPPSGPHAPGSPPAGQGRPLNPSVPGGSPQPAIPVPQPGYNQGGPQFTPRPPAQPLPIQTPPNAPRPATPQPPGGFPQQQAYRPPVQQGGQPIPIRPASPQPHPGQPQTPGAIPGQPVPPQSIRPSQPPYQQPAQAHPGMPVSPGQPGQVQQQRPIQPQPPFQQQRPTAIPSAPGQPMNPINPQPVPIKPVSPQPIPRQPQQFASSGVPAQPPQAPPAFNMAPPSSPPPGTGFPSAGNPAHAPLKPQENSGNGFAMREVAPGEFEMPDDADIPPIGLTLMPLDDDEQQEQAEPFLQTPQKQEEDFQFPREEYNKGPRLQEREKLRGNEMVYKLALTVITVAAFFTLKVLTTIQIGLKNPYDKLFFIRLLIFLALVGFTTYAYMQKSLSREKDSLFKKITISFVVAVFIGSFVGTTGIGVSAGSNFFLASGTDYYRLVDIPNAISRNPAISPNGKNVVCTYSADRRMAPVITLLALNLDDKDKPADIKRTSVIAHGKMDWLSPTEIIYPAEKIGPYDPFAFKLLNPNTGDDSIFFTSRDFAYIGDFQYNIETGKIAASSSGLIWSIDPETYEAFVISGLDNLLREADPKPDYTSFKNNPQGFITSLSNEYITMFSYAFSDSRPTFTSDGKTVYFIRTVKNNNTTNEIYRVQVDKLLDPKSAQSINSYDDMHEYFYDSSEQITSNPYKYTNLSSSPKGRFVASWVTVTSGEGSAVEEKALVLVDAQEKTHVKVFPFYQTDANITSIDWSQDGKYLVGDMSGGMGTIVVLIEVPSLIQNLDEKYKVTRSDKQE
ncbi:MAG: PD40 domain-containing protein [Acidobacteria bacterium]|nr:PD40 domain-containing protein [Acidobacteriota bacterium]